jgi:hypothetical protein
MNMPHLVGRLVELFVMLSVSNNKESNNNFKTILGIGNNECSFRNAISSNTIAESAIEKWNPTLLDRRNFQDQQINQNNYTS